MSEPYWTPLGGQPVDYEGAWAVGTQYAPGDVVVYNGVNYLAVNPSLGSVPPAGAVSSDIGLAFPASPFDGQVFTLVDSLTAPTYAWRFIYMAAKATNKWLFIGGPPQIATVAAEETTTLTQTYQNLTTLGPSIAIPVAGDYIVRVSAFAFNASNADPLMSYDIGATAAVDTDGARSRWGNGGNGAGIVNERRKALTAVTLTAKYKNSDTVGTATFGDRVLTVTPIAVGG